MKHFIVGKITLMAISLALVHTPVGAITLAPGDTVPIPGSTAAGNPELGGVVLQDTILPSTTLQVPPEANPLVNFADFEIQNRVVQSNADSTLIFAPRILFGRNVTGFPLLVERVEMSGFGDFAIDATYRTDGLGDRGPSVGSRSGDGQTLSFDFGFPLFVNNLFAGPQEESYFFSLKTDATAFENTGRLSIFAQAVGDPVQGREYRFDVGELAVPVDLPTVPLPASLPLLVFGFATMALFRRAIRS